MLALLNSVLKRSGVRDVHFGASTIIQIFIKHQQTIKEMEFYAMKQQSNRI